MYEYIYDLKYISNSNKAYKRLDEIADFCEITHDELVEALHERKLIHILDDNILPQDWLCQKPYVVKRSEYCGHQIIKYRLNYILACLRNPPRDFLAEKLTSVVP